MYSKNKKKKQKHAIYFDSVVREFWKFIYISIFFRHSEQMVKKQKLANFHFLNSILF